MTKKRPSVPVELPAAITGNRLIVEVTEAIHFQVKTRAVLASRTVKTYLLWVLQNREPGPSQTPIESARGRKRLVADLTEEEIDEIRQKASERGMTVREYVLRCLEADGVNLKDFR